MNNSNKVFCKSCGIYKGKKEFHKNKRAKDGVQHYCKECVKEKREMKNKEFLQKCTKCGKEKPITEFHKDSTKTKGIRSRCKECCSTKGKSKEMNAEQIKLNVEEAVSKAITPEVEVIRNNENQEQEICIKIIIKLDH